MTHALRDNRWMSFEDVISECAERWRDISSHNIDRGVWIMWASQACRQFAQQSGVVKGVHSVALVKDQYLYRLPDDCIGPSMVTILYPGEDLRRLDPDNIEYFRDGVRIQSGLPDVYFQTKDRLSIGIDPAPSKGGFIGYAVGGAAFGTSIIGPNTMSATDDAYTGLYARCLDGVNQGQIRLITDYVGATRTMIFGATQFTNQVAAGTRFEVHPDSLIIDYVQNGNSFTVLPTTDYAVKAGSSRNYEGFALNLPVRPENWWAGCEVRFVTGNLLEAKTRIVTSSVDVANAWTQLGTYPELPIIPAIDDKVRVTDVPNIPPAFHSNLVDYAVAMAMIRKGVQGAGDLMALFAKGVEDAVASDQPPDADKFEQIDTTDIEEDMW